MVMPIAKRKIKFELAAVHGFWELFSSVPFCRVLSGCLCHRRVMNFWRFLSPIYYHSSLAIRTINKQPTFHTLTTYIQLTLWIDTMCGAGGHDHHGTTDVNTDNNSNPPVLALPAHLYAHLTDAHCHIQDDRKSIRTLVESWSASTTPSSDESGVTPLLTGKVCLMGVQPSKDLGLAPPTTEDGNSKLASLEANAASLSLNSSSLSSSSIPIVTVSWNDTDVQGDWDLVAKLAETHPDRFVPCFGIHPWFTHKYKPLEGGYKGSTIELRGVSNSNSNAESSTAGGGASSSSDSPSLSFSSAFLTPVPGPGVRREAFLAMSKQLQEQMAKESREKEGVAQTETTNDIDNKQTDVFTLKETSANEENKEAREEKDSTPLDVTIPNADDARFSHYKTVLSLPTSATESYLADLAKRLPTPRALEPALQELRRQLEAHPHAVLGEIGLDRTARVPEPSFVASSSSEKEGSEDSSTPTTGAPQKRITLALTSIQHQLDIVREQLKLAAALDRPVSFHCVQAYGHWHDFLIQEGRRLRQLEADQEYQIQLAQIQASGGTIQHLQPALSPTGGVRLSKRSTARLKREARDAAWERHVASTLQESSDEEDEEESDEDEDDDSDSERKPKAKVTTTPKDIVQETIAPTPAPETTLQPAYEPVLPPRLCMHSYGGSVDMLKAFTKLDHPPEIYFSFSILINGRLQERKLKELIQAVPEDRLLIESDHHSHNHVDQLLVEMVLKVAEIRNWSVEETVERTARNWHRFVYGDTEQ
ncbi:MAG: TatD family [Linnemannia elongata]|nr:MAG: TatD family [Linnemannia elongata]